MLTACLLMLNIVTVSMNSTELRVGDGDEEASDPFHIFFPSVITLLHLSS